jgi:beta-lactamase superfamily II metal-dependent hydrolase
VSNLEKKKPLIKITAIIVFLIVSNIFIVFQNFGAEKVLKVYFLDVSQGDSILIETPNGTQVLIDAGPNNKVITELSEIIPIFDRTIDIIIPTHSDLDHVGGFPEILRRFEIKNYFDSGFVDEDDLNTEIKQLVQNEKNINIKKITRGENIMLDKENNISFEVLWPTSDYETDDNNDRSVVLLLNYGKISFIFTGDASSKIENILVENSASTNILDVDILKAGHHGSKTASNLEFLKKVSPEFTIISAGKDNKFGHPNKEVLDNLAKTNSQIKNTAEVGRILIKSDGEKYWIDEK